MASFHNPATVPVHAQLPVPYGAPAAALPPQSHHHLQHPQQQHRHHPHHSAAAAAAVPAPPAGTFSPGTKIQVGNHRIVITKYLTEGGFAHVYLVKLARPVDGTDVAVLKRVAVPDKESLRGMRTEVETMKRLKGHRPIVTYIDSHASELRGGGYEVFLLMEYCNGGGLMNFMNTRLQHRLTEPEILAIITDVAEGVACMHYLKPPLLHRDLKVENVLITASPSGRRTFKLCDFGSAAPPRPAPSTVVECRLMDEDVQMHTTPQYRAPEMVDVYRRQPLDEKIDIWALGVLLYKLCYYTTPFEDQSQLAILNASFRYPSLPVFSGRLKALIGSMLKESQQERPNIYQVLRESCGMQGREVPIHDIYTRSPATKDTPKMDKAPSHTPPVVGAAFSSPSVQQQSSIPDVVPMRRGRPAATPAASQDPFAALDSKFMPAPSSGDDELSARFPTLDQFALLHDPAGAQFDFDSSTTASPPLPGAPASQGTGRPVDDAFATIGSPPASRPVSTRPKSVAPVASPPIDGANNPYHATSPPAKAEMSRAQAIIANNPELQAFSSSSKTYVSTGTMTSPTPPPLSEQRREGTTLYRSPDPSIRANLSRPPDSETSAPPSSSCGHLRSRASQGNIARTSSFTPQPALGYKASSSRPSLEGGRPEGEFADVSSPSKLPPKPRPVSGILSGNGEPDWLLSRGAKASPPLPSPPGRNSPHLIAVADDGPTNVESNVEFLRSMEESDPKKKDKGAKHGRRGSSLSLAGTKSMLAGKFGDAFKRFESGGGNSQDKVPPARTPSPLKLLERRNLTPIAGSEATDGRSDDGRDEDEDADTTPEMRREMERLQLAEEERRVEAAKAEYHQRLAQKDNPLSSGAAPLLPKSIGGVSRAVSIQNRVQSLLEDTSTSNVVRTAQGYGKYTDTGPPPDGPEKKLPELPRRSPSLRSGTSPGFGEPRPPPKPQGASVPPSAAPSPAPIKAVPSGRPPAPRKPIHLNSIPTGGRSTSPTKSTLEHRGDAGEATGGDGVAVSNDEYLRDFAKRFPSLGAIEMVERDLDAVGRVAR